MRIAPRIGSLSMLSVAGIALYPALGARADTGSKPAYADEIRTWRKQRVERLTSDTGWLTVAGLFWLQEGDNTFGTGAKNTIVLPPGSAGEFAGLFEHHDRSTTVRALPGTTLRLGGEEIMSHALRSDADGTPDIVEMGRLRFFVIHRGERDAIRMRDLQCPERLHFRGIVSYPINARWRVEARYEPYSPPKKLAIASIIGTVDSMLCPGALSFTLDGHAARLDPVLEEADATELFLIFRDATSGEETYGAGRFLYADLPQNGTTVVDFNKAYNPPCAFTAFATCPLPPRQNEMPFAVRAGEKKYGHH